MPNALEGKDQAIPYLIEKVSLSMEQVVPLQVARTEPALLGQSLCLSFGVLIGFTGDIKGKVILSGEPEVFGEIGQAMFGMPIEGEMLQSFSGELGNMIVGGFSTNIMEKEIKTDITAPTIMQGSTTLSGYENAYELLFTMEQVGKIKIFFLLDELMVKG